MVSCRRLKSPPQNAPCALKASIAACGILLECVRLGGRDWLVDTRTHGYAELPDVMPVENWLKLDRSMN